MSIKTKVLAVFFNCVNTKSTLFEKFFKSIDFVSRGVLKIVMIKKSILKTSVNPVTLTRSFYNHEFYLNLEFRSFELICLIIFNLSILIMFLLVVLMLDAFLI